MFGKKTGDGSEAKAQGEEGTRKFDAPPLKPFSKKGSHTPGKPPGQAAFRPEIPRRVVEIPGSPRRIEPARPVNAETRALRKAHRGQLFLAGLVIALLLTVPVVNLLAPVTATAVMVHLFELWRTRGQAA